MLFRSPKLHTSGNSNLKEIIYHIYGRDIASNLLEIQEENERISVSGFIGKPLISRGNRNYENYFINGRYIKSALIARSIEEGYKSFVMQHKFPFTVLHISINGKLLDVNVHPTKMELRFSEGESVYQFLTDMVKRAINQSELVYQVSLENEKEAKKRQEKQKREHLKSSRRAPEPFETKRLEAVKAEIRKDSPYEKKYEQPPESVKLPAEIASKLKKRMDTEFPLSGKMPELAAETADGCIPPQIISDEESEDFLPAGTGASEGRISEDGTDKPQSGEYRQQELPQATRKLLDISSQKDHRVIGQLFETYWLVEFDSQLYIIDQHAAHEKVLYERTMKSLEDKEYTSQAIYPPILLTLNMQEEELLHKYMGHFRKLGFELEHFGGKEYAVTAVPANLFGLEGKELMVELLDSLSQFHGKETPQMVTEKIASMSCKAAVKGNQKLSRQEVEALIGELLTLDNPYHCPHGRPTIISMTKYELEKKFKRVL